MEKEKIVDNIIDIYPEEVKKIVEKILNKFPNSSMSEIVKRIDILLEEQVVVFSGSFDPWTYGHEAVVRDYLRMNPNSKVKVVLWVNPNKKGTFTPKQRKILIEKTLWDDLKDRVEVDIYSGLIADYVYENWYSHIIKWVRNDVDFVYEKDIATLSKRFSWDVMTSFIPQIDSLKAGISSSSFKALFSFGWDVYSDASPVVREALRMKQSWQWIIGLTWWIASWKTTFWKWLEELSEKTDIKIHYLNLDKITNIIHTSDKEFCVRARNKIKEQFWDEVLLLDWTTNKKILWDIVFKDELKMQKLMDIMLEPLIHLLKKQISKIDTPWIILVEWAIIFDRGLTYLFDENIIHIWVSPEKQRERVEKRDWLTKKQIEHRLKSQVSKQERIQWIKNNQDKYSDRFFLDIDGENYDLENIVSEILNEYKKRREMFWNHE